MIAASCQHADFCTPKLLSTSGLAAVALGSACLQTAVMALAAKRRGRIKDGAFDEMCCMHATKVMPPGNYYPRSFYLMKKVIGVKDARSIQVGAC